ncbi:hypothetical protein UPYG_G00078330 [Umbra pygmaea]|uniref:Uncharacterized protein n=1 Tax=Umbra pygmaea TaxID=75934 RepID=A0ABD0XGM3_UMBPY
MKNSDITDSKRELGFHCVVHNNISVRVLRIGPKSGPDNVDGRVVGGDGRWSGAQVPEMKVRSSRIPGLPIGKGWEAGPDLRGGAKSALPPQGCVIGKAEQIDRLQSST